MTEPPSSLSAWALEREKADLSRADQHIADGEQRITEQAARIERLREDGHDASRPERLLARLIHEDGGSGVASVA